MTRLRQTGVSLISAIFVLVVLTALGTYMVTISGTQHLTVASSVQGAKAYHAARSGLEWGIWGALNNTAAVCGGTASSPVTSSFAVAGFTTSVTCSYQCQQEASVRMRVFTILAVANQGVFGSTGYVSRRVQASVTDAPASPAACL